MHLLIDGFGGDVRRMQDEEFVYGFLDAFPLEIGMNKISAPYVTTYRGPRMEDWGVTGFVIIAESHISVHTFPERAFVNIDVFSCKDFDHERALAQIREAFSLEQVKVWVLERGLDYSTPGFSSSVRRERAEALSGEVGP